ncbi:hypothetical protein Hanom_Chr02g00133941 [Helianthus anomalus]
MKKWFRKSTERKFKRPLKFYKRDREVSLSDIISWGFLPQRVDPVTGIEETILHVKKPKVIKNIPVPKMEQDFHTGFLYWVYSCLTTEAVITYRVENEVRYISVNDPLWLVNCLAKDIECFFVKRLDLKLKIKTRQCNFRRLYPSVSRKESMLKVNGHLSGERLRKRKR